MTTTKIRRLASSEVGFVGPAPTTCAFELTARGALDLAALSDAFAALRAAHPALDATVRAEGDGFVFAAPSATAPGAPLTVERAEFLPDPWSTPGVDPSVALGRLHVVTTGRLHRITLACNHALTDGTHLYALLTELFAQYSQLVRAAVTLSARTHEFPASAQDVLADGPPVPDGVDTGRDRLAGTRWYGRSPVRKPAHSGPVAPEVASLDFAPDTTERFVAAARGIGVSAMLAGIALCAERAGFVDESPDAEIPVGAMTLVDLRRRVRPELAPTEVTNFVGASFAAPLLTSRSDPLAVGSAIASTVRSDLNARRCLAVLAERDPRPSVHPPVVLSNLGALEIELPPNLIGERLRPIVAMDSAALHGPAEPTLPAPSATIYQMSTFAGRLGIEAITLGGTADPAARRAVSTRLAELVHTAALTPAS